MSKKVIQSQRHQITKMTFINNDIKWKPDSTRISFLIRRELRDLLDFFMLSPFPEERKIMQIKKYPVNPV